MEWSATSATKAYLETLQLCNNYQNKRSDSWKTREPGSNEFISALAAGTKSKLIVEIKSSVSPSTIALATAAKHTGARFVCILPEAALPEAKKDTKDSGLIDVVEFKTGDPTEILQNYEKIDFSLVDCKNDHYPKLLKMINLNPEKAVVVADNLAGDKEGLGGYVTGMKNKVPVRSMKHPIGKGMEITTIGRTVKSERRDQGGKGHFGAERRGIPMKKTAIAKSKWIVKVDEESGEEHIFRLPRSL
ncbi:uncharacterized protein LOC111305964 isoform X1 [Durio zibethinus]|uniref:Uncharacterized protein LOC111305964 isoform X1 n=1 Tax=Durio zibethinus TaxID=66656 RepID=A0A6P6A3L3_DURZI|nr:uncharacterized protein LOC111305964 isoform X1 [Durio zibethinus]